MTTKQAACQHKTKTKKLRTFTYFGGKFRHLNWLLPLLPTRGVSHYCEPFCGAASVLLNRLPAKYETINDLNGDIANFFQVLRDDGDDLMRRLELTPYSRREFVMAGKSDSRDLVENARLFFIRMRQSFFGKGMCWGYAIVSCSQPLTWINAIAGLTDVISRLRLVQIENLPAIDILSRYDSPQTLFYLDPPYMLDTRVAGKAYKHEMTTDEHLALLQIALKCKAKVAISGYKSELYQDMLSDWHLSTLETTTSISATKAASHAERTECLWTNYDPHETCGQSAFDW